VHIKVFLPRHNYIELEKQGYMRSNQSFEGFKMKNVLITDDLWYLYERQKEPALRNINLEISEGDFVLVAGPTGCGKSTLALCLAGLIPHVLGGKMKGKVVVDGKDTRNFEVFQLAQSIGLVFQNAESQLCSLNVEDEVAFGPENLAHSRKEIEKRVNFALNAAGMYDLRHKYTFNLSGGQKQRTVIASTLSMLPKILVLDEPLSELDPAGSREVLQALKKLNEEFCITIVLIEHKLEQVLGFAKSVILLKDGRIVANGEPSEVFKDKKLDGMLGLRIPETLKLSYELLERGLLEKPVLSVEEASAFVPQMWVSRLSHPLDSNRVLNQEKNRSTQNELIKAEGLCYIYGDGTVALQDIDLRVFPGEFIAILGGNGAGKTTLALQMSGQLKPTKGKMYIEGKDSTKLGITDLAGIVGYTFQNPDCQLFSKTVNDEIAFGPKHLGLPEEKINRRVKEVLHVMRLEQFKDRDPLALSRGQKLSVAVASVLAMKPKILILDEPTLGQDLNQIRLLMMQLRSLNRQGLAVVVITHDVNIAAEYVCRAILMDKGKILADGDAHAVFSEEDLLLSASFKPPTAVYLSKLAGLPPMLTVSEISTAIWGAN
jgi:energy-coupling factor transporter ATP-binding protein EcfA2